jgi:tRNA A37 threonylcarbamoyladenosine biosynthesis protein TsaE
VEWPERAPALFPEETLHVFLTVKDTNRRTLQISNK